MSKRVVLAAAATVVIAPILAMAQSQLPGPGDWSGTYYVESKLTCVAQRTAYTDAAGVSHPAGTFSTDTNVCKGTQPWTGGIYGANFQLLKGAGTIICDNSFATPTGPVTTTTTSTALTAASGIEGGVISSDGSGFAMPGGTYTGKAPEADSCTVTYCSAANIALTANTMSGLQLCTQYATIITHSTDPGVQPQPQTPWTQTSNCTLYSTNSYYGTKNGSGAAAAPLTQPTLVFPIAVTSDITATSASATAQVAPPATLLCTTGSVYVFAHARLSQLAPSPVTKRATQYPKDGPSTDPCVLAQLNSAGQLVQTSSSTMQAYTTGVLTAQTQSVTVLNNVPTSNVAGASFFVGYGSDASSMLSNGTYQGAVTVPGPSSCSTTVLAAATPNLPSALSGLWWAGTSESGWGVTFTQRRNVVVAAWYTYDASGNPKWYFASNCNLPTNVTGATGTCTGPVYEVTGPTFFGTAFNPSLVHVNTVGNLQVNFQDASTATMSYTVNGVTRSVGLVREPFWTGTTPPAVDYTDLWFNPNESGWGLVVTQQFGMVFLAWYVYDANGRPVWYVAPNCSLEGSSCSSPVYATIGPPFGPTFDTSAVHASQVGSITVSFTDPNNATMSFTVNGTSGTKQITRQTF